jgi:hypothetical protein
MKPMNVLVTFISASCFHQASCLQRASATQHPNLKPQRLCLRLAPAAEPITWSWAGRTSSHLSSDDIRMDFFLQPSSALKPVRLAFPLPVLVGSLKGFYPFGWELEVGIKSRHRDPLVQAGGICGKGAFCL